MAALHEGLEVVREEREGGEEEKCTKDSDGMPKGFRGGGCGDVHVARPHPQEVDRENYHENGRADGTSPGSIEGSHHLQVRPATTTGRRGHRRHRQSSGTGRCHLYCHSVGLRRPLQWGTRVRALKAMAVTVTMAVTLVD